MNRDNASLILYMSSGGMHSVAACQNGICDYAEKSTAKGCPTQIRTASWEQ